MIDLEKAKKAFKDYLQSYDNQDDHGFNLKIVHTYHVVENAENISKALSLSEEDIKLACVIALLHDLGRFDELKNRKRFDSVGNDHALFATKLLCFIISTVAESKCGCSSSGRAQPCQG